MHCASAALVAGVVALNLTLFASSTAQTLSPVHGQRYSMGTMFDIVVYHGSRDDAESAIENAFAEISRLDDVLSHYKAGSNLSKLNREARRATVHVDPSLFDVLSQSTALSRRSGGKFDVTIAPLLRTWKAAAAQGRRPTSNEVDEARRCVGSEKIRITPPDEIAFLSDCLELDLGGIGKGFAVDRALAVLKSAGIQHAMINAGGSSIAAMGAPPGRTGWPVLLGGTTTARRLLLLKGNSVSTSKQDPDADFGHIIDPDTGAPVDPHTSVSVVAPHATLSDALSTTVLILSRERAEQLLAEFESVSALWISPDGELRGVYGRAHLELLDAR